MAANVQLGDLISFVRKRGDIEGYSQLDRHPDEDLTGYINRGVKAWYEVINRKPGRYVASLTYTTTSGVTLYPLPTGGGAAQPDFWRALNVSAIVAGRQEWLSPFEEFERPRLSDPAGSWYGAPTRYALMGVNLELLPPPGAGTSVTLRYIPVAPQLSSSTDSVDFINGEEDYVIDYAARLAMAKDAQWDVVSHLENDMSAQISRIQDESPKRDMSLPGRVTDLAFSGRASLRRRRF